MNAAKYRKMMNRQPGECTWCGGTVPAGRKTWCSEKCVDEYRQKYEWAYIRRKVLERDKGICSICGIDCQKIHRIIMAVRFGRNKDDYETWQYLRRFYLDLGIKTPIAMDYWQADHIVPRCLGGANELDNLRTLCIACHKAETAKLRKLLATTKRTPRNGGNDV